MRDYNRPGSWLYNRGDLNPESPFPDSVRYHYTTVAFRCVDQHLAASCSHKALPPSLQLFRRSIPDSSSTFSTSVGQTTEFPMSREESSGFWTKSTECRGVSQTPGQLWCTAGECQQRGLTRQGGEGWLCGTDRLGVCWGPVIDKRSCYCSNHSSVAWSTKEEVSWTVRMAHPSSSLRG